MTNTTKTFAELTIAEKFSAIAETVQNQEMATFLQERANQTVAKNAKKAENRKPTKAQLENQVFVNKVSEWLEANAKNTATEATVFSANQIFEGAGIFDFTPQKQTAILKKAIEQGKAIKSDAQVKDDNGRKKVGYTVPEQA